MTPTMDKKPVSKHQGEAYDRLLATHPQVERKGKTLPYTAVNGHMFTVFSNGDDVPPSMVPLPMLDVV